MVSTWCSCPTLSADLQVPGRDKWIDNLDDLLYDPIYQNFRPTIVAQLNVPNALSCSLNGSKERELLNRAIATDSLVTVKLDKLYIEVMELLEDADNHTRAVIEDKSFADIFIGQSRVSRGTRDGHQGGQVPRNPCTTWPAAMVLSHSTDRRVVDLFEYRSRASAEFGIMEGFIRRFTGSVFESMGVKRTITGFICSETFNNIIPKDLSDDWNPLPFHFIGRFTNICIAILSVSFMVLFYEILFDLAIGDRTTRVKAVVVTGRNKKVSTVPKKHKYTRQILVTK